MIRDYAQEVQTRTLFIREMLEQSGCKGIVFGNSGGKDSALTGILCRKACDNVTGIIMPCHSRRNYEADAADAETVAKMFDIKMRRVDLTPVREALVLSLQESCTLTAEALANVAPRLRMTTLYAAGQSMNCLVAGTGNRSEAYMGYFTKWGDGAHDFNPIADLTVREVYEFLRYFGAPEKIIKKAPSAGLFDGQTDEGEMGILYSQIDDYLLEGKGTPEVIEKIERFHQKSLHKTKMPAAYGE